MIWSSGSSPTRYSTSWSRIRSPLAVRNPATRPLAADRRDAHGGVLAGLLLRAHGRRPGLHAEDLLRPCAAGDRRALRLRVRRDHGHPAPAHARVALRPA